MTRLFDIFFALLGLLFLSPLLLLLWALAWLDNRSPLFKQQRVGRNQAPFVLVKFRTMRPDTASVATHLADTSAITPFGRFLRRTKLDELPQLWNVLRGDMSLVGPRPALFNQDDLVALRRQSGVEALRPGITGWAQVRGRDDLSIEKKAALDAEYLRKRSFLFDLRILILTVFQVLKSEGIQH